MADVNRRKPRLVIDSRRTHDHLLTTTHELDSINPLFAAAAAAKTTRTVEAAPLGGGVDVVPALPTDLRSEIEKSRPPRRRRSPSLLRRLSSSLKLEIESKRRPSKSKANKGKRGSLESNGSRRRESVAGRSMHVCHSPNVTITIPSHCQRDGHIQYNVEVEVLPHGPSYTVRKTCKEFSFLQRSLCQENVDEGAFKSLAEVLSNRRSIDLNDEKLSVRRTRIESWFQTLVTQSLNPVATAQLFAFLGKEAAERTCRRIKRHDDEGKEEGGGGRRGCTSAGSVSHSGYLSVLEGGKRWRRRWFVLQDDLMHYDDRDRHERGGSPTCVTNLSFYTVTTGPQKMEFTVHSSSPNDLVLRAETEQDMKNWIAVLMAP